MIKKYAALCLIISNLTLCAAEEKSAETTFVISSKKTAWFQSLNTRFNIVMNRQQQEHTTQQQQMKQEHEENIKKLSQIFIAREQERDIIFTKQLDDNNKRIEEQAKNVQEALNSSATYQLIKLILESKEANRANHLAQVEKNKNWLKALGGATAISYIISIINLCAEKNRNPFNLLFSFATHAILGSLIYYVTDSSNLQNNITNDEETIKRLETILIRLQPATENIHDETFSPEQDDKHNNEEVQE